MADWIRVKKQNPCPICGKPDWCLISEDGKSVICARVESDKPVGNAGAGWLHSLEDRLYLPVRQPIAQARGYKTGIHERQPDVLNQSYEALLDCLLISDTHRESLRRRGLTDDDIDRLNYKSLMLAGRFELMTKLNILGVRMIGVPGFYRRIGQWQLAGPEGILIPVKDVIGRIIGMQIRCDHIENGKYKWLSSLGMDNGCSPGAPVHVAGHIKVWRSSEIWITEGPIKADIANIKLGFPVLAVAGVGNWRGIIPIIADFNPKKVVVAFDMDKNSNPQVRLHLDALIDYLLKAKRQTFEVNWNKDYKGLDDLLTSDLANNVPIRSLYKLHKCTIKKPEVK